LFSDFCIPQAVGDESHSYRRHRAGYQTRKIGSEYFSFARWQTEIIPESSELGATRQHARLFWQSEDRGQDISRELSRSFQNRNGLELAKQECSLGPIGEEQHGSLCGIGHRRQDRVMA